MRNFKVIASTAIAISAVVSLGAASAADMAQRAYSKAPPMIQEVYNWTGFYIGVEGGGGRARAHVVDIPGNDSPVRGDGGLFGVTAGYNWQFASPLVVGVEGDFSWSDLKAIGTDAEVRPTCTAGGIGQCGTALRDFGTARGRAGFAWDRFLVYGTVGVGFGELRSIESNPNIGTFFSTSTRSGLVYGAGVEGMIIQNWTAKVEYLHVDLGDAPATGTVVSPRQPLSFRADIVRAGINYKWGGPVVAKY